MSTTTLIVFADPANGDEALGRLLNALAAAHELDQRRETVQIVFQGTGTRWPALLQDPSHPGHALFKAVEHRLAGASLGCAALFGAEASVASAGVPFLTDNPLPGTAGMASIASYAASGHVITF